MKLMHLYRTTPNETEVINSNISPSLVRTYKKKKKKKKKEKRYPQQFHKDLQIPPTLTPTTHKNPKTRQEPFKQPPPKYANFQTPLHHPLRIFPQDFHTKINPTQLKLNNKFQNQLLSNCTTKYRNFNQSCLSYTVNGLKGREKVIKPAW
jgi:hypothetical protein